MQMQGTDFARLLIRATKWRRTPTASRPCNCRASSASARTGPPGCYAPSCAGPWSIRNASPCAASSRPTRRSFRSAPRRTPWSCRPAAVGSARCWSPARSNSTAACRARLKVIEGFGKDEIHAFVLGAVAPNTRLVTDDWPSYDDIPDITHKAITVGPMAAHIVLPWTHRLFSNLKRWGLGVYHGLRRANLQHYLDEFVFRFNRRRTRYARKDQGDPVGS